MTMKPTHYFTALSIALFLLAACSPASMVTPDVQASMNTPDVPATKAAAAAATAAQAAQELQLFPLAEPGAYPVGMRTYRLTDPNRDDRRVSISIWYPAVQPSEATDNSYTVDADPDFSGAPYPLLLSSTKVASIFAPYLVSRGFTWASVNFIDAYEEMGDQMYNQPLDILFALEQAASNPPGLEGMIDAEHAGAIGYSFDGYNTLAMSGARIDPQFYLSLCENPDAKKAHSLSAFSCKPARNWDAFSVDVGETITRSEDGLWQPMTDVRIRAVMPLACEGWWLFGEKGLAAVNRPVLMIVASDDQLYAENVQIFDHLGTPNKGLISFIGLSHMMVFNPQQVARMAHFAAAFFGYHLQGKAELAQYFSEDFVNRHTDIHWGAYRGVHVPTE